MAVGETDQPKTAWRWVLLLAVAVLASTAAGFVVGLAKPRPKNLPESVPA